MTRKKGRILGQNRKLRRGISFHEFYKSREPPPKPEYVLVKDQSKGGNKLKWHTLEDAKRILSLPALSVPPLEEPERDKPTSTRRKRRKRRASPEDFDADVALDMVIEESPSQDWEEVESRDSEFTTDLLNDM